MTEPYPYRNTNFKFLSVQDLNPQVPMGPVGFNSGIHPQLDNRCLDAWPEVFQFGQKDCEWMLQHFMWLQSVLLYTGHVYILKLIYIFWAQEAENRIRNHPCSFTGFVVTALLF